MESHLQCLADELNGMVDLKVIVSNSERRTMQAVIDGVNVTRVGKLCDIKSAPVNPALVQEIRRSQADIVHIHWPNPTAVLAYLASGHQGRLVFTYHSDIVRQRMLAIAFTPILRLALRKAAAIIVTSPNYIDSSDILSEFRSKCHVVPFGVSVDHFEQCDHKRVSRIRQRYGPRIVLAVGRMVYYKGFEHLVRAMKFVDGNLIIIGNGPLRKHLGQVAADCNVDDRVAFLTEVDEIRPYYHAADVFVLSSVMRSEAFGIVQLEAMACGKPIINTDLNSGVTFVSPHEVSGLTVPPADSEALAESINQLLDQPYYRAELGKRAKLRVAHQFTVENMVQRTFHLYQQIMLQNSER
jgi:rhamnosyl/mannosyltransferase